MRKMKISTIILSIAVMFMSLTGCTSNSDSNGSSVNSGQTKFRVGMITDEGGIGDKSFNDSTYEGLVRASKDLSVEVQVLEPKQDSEFEAYMDRISKNSDLVIGVGYKLKDALRNSSVGNPNVNYVLIDDEVEGSNVQSLLFKDEEGSFLAGVLAGLMTEGNSVGFMGGIDSPLIRKFEAGFIAGVKSVNEEAGLLLENGTTSRYAGSFTDVSKGYEIAKSLYDSGVDIIYHAAGGVGIGMFRAASETGNYAIGVDEDQAVSIPEYSDVIITSVVKNLSGAVYEIVKNTLESGFTSGTTQLGLKEEGVYLSKNGGIAIPQEVLDTVEDFKNRIINGEIRVPTTIDEVRGFSINS